MKLKKRRGTLTPCVLLQTAAPLWPLAPRTGRSPLPRGEDAPTPATAPCVGGPQRGEKER
jgi:hypothetical protein